MIFSSDKLIIVGIGGLAKELWVMLNRAGITASFFSEDMNVKMPHKLYVGYDSIKNFDKDNIKIMIGIGDPIKRETLYNKFFSFGYKFYSYIADGVINYGTIQEGCIIYPGVKLGPNCNISKNSIINYNCVIGHDSIIGEHSVVSPGVNLAGKVVGGKGVIYGIGSSVIQEVKIGDYATIASGSSVWKDIAKGTTVYGVPASKMNSIWKKS